MSLLRQAAPAKVNLALAVTGRRADGYHMLRSVFLRLALADELEVEAAPEDHADSLVVEGEPGAPLAGNLVLRAAERLRTHLDVSLPALRFRLTKRIPVSAGLGGGSSDAAAAIDLALTAWGARLRPAARLAVALELGADVPFFSAGHGAAFVSGIGDGLAWLPSPAPAAGILLLTPPQRLATAAVFAALDRDAATPRLAARLVDDAVAALRSGMDGQGRAALGDALRDANDLWPPAARCAPTLSSVRAAAEEALGRATLLSGSGTTLFAVYPSGADAERAAERLRSDRPPELEGAAIIATSTSREEGQP